MMFKNNKASIGSTFTWMVGTIIIILIMVLYIVFTLGIFKINGAFQFSAESYKSYGQTPSGISSFISYLNLVQADGKSPLEKVKDEDFSSLEKDFRWGSEEMRRLLNAECYILKAELGRDSKFTYYQKRDSGASSANMEKNLENIYLISNNGNIITLRYYGGSCIK